MDIHKAESKPRPSGLRQSHSVVDLAASPTTLASTLARSRCSDGNVPNAFVHVLGPEASPRVGTLPSSATSSHLDSTSSPSPSPSPSSGGLRGAMSRRGVGDDGGGDDVVPGGSQEPVEAVLAHRRRRGGTPASACCGGSRSRSSWASGSGSVYKAWRKVDGSRRSSRMLIKTQGDEESAAKYAAVAVKVMDKAKILEINETAPWFRRQDHEVGVQAPFIVSMLESFQTPSAMFIVMEYASGRTCSS